MQTKKIKPWSKRAVKAAKEMGIRHGLKPATGLSEDYLSHLIHGRAQTSPEIADKLGDFLDIPAHEFGQKRGKA